MYKNHLPAGVRVLLGFLSVILCLVLFVSVAAAILVADVRTITSKDGLQNIITQALFPTSSPVRAIPRLAGGFEMSGFGDLGELTGGIPQDAIVDSIYNIIVEQSGGELPISKEEVGQILEESTLPEFLTEKVSSIVSDVFTGESTTTITTDEVVKLLEDNAPLLEEHFDIQIDQTQLDAVSTWLEENNVVDTVKQEINNALGLLPPDLPDVENGIVTGSKVPTSILDLMDPEMAMPQTPAEILQLVRAVTSETTLWILIGLCAALFLLLLLTHWGRPFAAVRSAGIPVMLAGLLMLLPTAVASFIPAEVPMASLIQSIFAATGNISLAVAAGGLVMIVLGAVLNSVFKRRALAAAPVQEPDLSDLLLAEDAAE